MKDNIYPYRESRQDEDEDLNRIPKYRSLVRLVMENARGGVEKATPISEITASSFVEAIPSVIISRSDGPNQGQQMNGNSSSPSSTKNTNGVNSNGDKGKSCKGCLYYSSQLKASSRSPVCVGIPRTLPNVPRYMIGQSEMEASQEGRKLSDFKYACVGYSLYVERKKEGSTEKETPTELPVCVGLEILADRRVTTVDSAPVPTTNVQNREDRHGLPQRQLPKPTSSVMEDYFSRLARNAVVVGNGVTKNIRRVGNHIKHNLDELFDRRPK